MLTTKWHSILKTDFSDITVVKIITLITKIKCGKYHFIGKIMDSLQK